MPTTGGLFWKDVVMVLGSIFDQTCSGRIGTQRLSMLPLGFEVVICTVRSSSAFTSVK